MFENEVVTIDTWKMPKPKPRPKTLVDGILVDVYVPPPPVTVSEVKVSESGGMGMNFERPIIVPPYFEGKGSKQKAQRRRQLAQSSNPLEADSYAEFKSKFREAPLSQEE